jgi:hypothetical protein
MIAGRMLFAAVVTCLATAGSLAPGNSIATSTRVGETEVVVSTVRGTLGQSTRELAIEDNVFSEEVIETDADAATRIVFVDGTELSMGPFSRMVLDRYVYDPNAGTGELVMRVVSGVFEFASGNIPESAYDLRTPFGNLGIRGTRLSIVINPGSHAVVDVTEGVVESQGVTVGTEGCLLIPLPGTGTAELMSDEECINLVAPVNLMFALLGVPNVAPVAGPPDNFVGPGGDNAPPPAAGPGASPD